MSDRRYVAIFGTAVLTAGAATLAVYRMLGAAASPHLEPTRPVVVLTRDVPAGTPIPRDAIGLVPWPARVAPAESFAALDSVAGRVTRHPLTRGALVAAGELAPRGAAPGLESAIAPDRRAMAVRVSEPAGVSGLVRTDSRVDVLVTERDATAGRPVARLLMRNVRVLGVGPVRAADGTGAAGSAEASAVPASVASIVTLEVTPAQAEQLAAADGAGVVQVVLRGFASADSDAATDAPTAFTGAPPAGATTQPAPERDMRARLASLEATMRMAGARPVMARRLGFGADAQAPDTPPHTPPPAPAPAPAVAPTTDRRVESAAAPTAPASEAPAVVRVYRGGQLSVLRVERSDPGPEPAIRTASRAP